MTCMSGLERAINGPSNSWTAFRNSQMDEILWKDSEFTADDTSLFGSNEMEGQDLAFSCATPSPGSMYWTRPTEHKQHIAGPNGPSLYGNFGIPRPEGVVQGHLGDCWFLAAASAIAEQPERIERIIWNKEYNKQGAFRCYFWIKNGWYGVNIDDRIPTKKYGSRYRPFATFPSKNGAWWMPLLEKAYAKLDQNYDRIVGGWGYR